MHDLTETETQTRKIVDAINARETARSVSERDTLEKLSYCIWRTKGITKKDAEETAKLASTC